MSEQPTPWQEEFYRWFEYEGHEGHIWDKGGKLVLRFELAGKEDIKRIVHAVNCHEELLAALEEAVVEMEQYYTTNKVALSHARDAIRKAKGGGA